MKKNLLLLITVSTMFLPPLSMSAGNTDNAPIYLDNESSDTNTNSVVAPTNGLHPGSGTNSAGSNIEDYLDPAEDNGGNGTGTSGGDVGGTDGSESGTGGGGK